MIKPFLLLAMCIPYLQGAGGGPSRIPWTMVIGADTFTVCKTELMIDDAAYWERVSPQAFLDSLRSYGDGSLVIVGARPPAQWLAAVDPDALRGYLGDTTKCATVCYQYEGSANANTTSTLAAQMRYLLCAKRAGTYPPTACSFHHPCK